MKRKKIIPSMTESYDPYANAVAERVNGILKDEFMIEKCVLGNANLIKKSINLKFNLQTYGL